MSSSKHPYEGLTPDVMLDAVERFGVRCDGTFLALNSYENRVYQVGIEDAEPLIVKFYRPNRWTREAIGARSVVKSGNTAPTTVSPYLSARYRKLSWVVTNILRSTGIAFSRSWIQPSSASSSSL